MGLGQHALVRLSPGFVFKDHCWQSSRDHLLYWESDLGGPQSRDVFYLLYYGSCPQKPESKGVKIDNDKPIKNINHMKTHFGDWNNNIADGTLALTRFNLGSISGTLYIP